MCACETGSRERGPWQAAIRGVGLFFRLSQKRFGLVGFAWLGLASLVSWLVAKAANGVSGPWHMKSTPTMGYRSQKWGPTSMGHFPSKHTSLFFVHGEANRRITHVCVCGQKFFFGGASRKGGSKSIAPRRSSQSCFFGNPCLRSWPPLRATGARRRWSCCPCGWRPGSWPPSSVTCSA